MSISNGDENAYLIVTAGSPWTIGTGDFSIGLWANIPSAPPFDQEPIFTLTDARPPSIDDYKVAFRTSVGDLTKIAGRWGTTDLTAYSYTTATWYYYVLSRSGTTYRARIFDDSSSTTPLSDQTATVSTNITATDTIVIGNGNYGNNGCPAKSVSLKLHTGVEWTNAECRAESQSYAIVKSGGTDRLAWKLTTINNDTDGLKEIGGAGPDFTNSGAVTDAAIPTVLGATYTPPVQEFVKVLFRAP